MDLSHAPFLPPLGSRHFLRARVQFLKFIDTLEPLCGSLDPAHTPLRAFSEDLVGAWVPYSQSVLSLRQPWICRMRPSCRHLGAGMDFLEARVQFLKFMDTWSHSRPTVQLQSGSSRGQGSVS